MTSEVAEKMKNTAKQRDKLEYCIRCGFCEAVCPTIDVLGWDSAAARGRMTLLKAVLDGTIDLNEMVGKRIFQCTTCGFCQYKCPAGVDPLKVIIDARRDLVKLDMGPESHGMMVGAVKKFRNPYGKDHADKNIYKRNSSSNILYFMGCTAPFLRPDIVKGTMDVLDAAGVDYQVIGEDAWCCGGFMPKTGYDDAFEEVKKHNIQIFKDHGIDTIVCSCADCYNTLKNEYKMDGIEVLDYTEFVDRLLSEGKLKIEKNDDVVTWHDPCNLGRHGGVFDAPRRVLSKIANLVELEHNRENAYCCGGEPGVLYSDSALAEGIGKKRMEEADKTKADLLITSCPSCTIQLTKYAGSVPVMNFAEYIASRVRSG
jgi:heterodisulfide reductase subunit D